MAAMAGIGAMKKVTGTSNAVAMVAVSPGTAPLLWMTAASAALIVAASTGRFERAVGLVLAGSVWVPVATSRRHLRTVFVMVGVPWLVYFVAAIYPTFTYGDVPTRYVTAVTIGCRNVLVEPPC
jgi:sulfite exporter TauE/SafE